MNHYFALGHYQPFMALFFKLFCSRARTHTHMRGNFEIKQKLLDPFDVCHVIWKIACFANSREYDETQVIATSVHILLPTTAACVLFHRNGTRNTSAIKVFPPSIFKWTKACVSFKTISKESIATVIWARWLWMGRIPKWGKIKSTKQKQNDYESIGVCVCIACDTVI